MASQAHSVEKGPLLLSEVPSSQLYTDRQVAQVKSGDEQWQKGHELNLTGKSFLEKDYLLYQKVQQTSLESVAQSDLDFLREASKHKPLAYQKHPEGPIATPVFDVASLASHKLFLHDVNTQKQQLSSQLSTSPELFVRQSMGSAVDTEAARQLLITHSQLTPTTTHLLVKGYREAIEVGDGAQQSLLLLKTIAEEASDFEAAQAVLNASIRSPHKHQLLTQLHRFFSDAEQEALLSEQINGKTDLASQAIIQYGQLASSVRNNHVLYSNLSDAALGASSALAISRVNKTHPDYSVIVNNLKHNKSSRTFTANNLLVLKLTDNSESRAVLKDILDKGYIQYSDMRAEVASWLQ
ncbi:hypothetical protein GCM10023151_05250 [Kangiella marina]|uniref:Uncharacterized protein n=1 Tax=Kangiella marina TaxID=1079178 RepID=A0ABP8IDU6_9GAMM